VNGIWQEKELEESKEMIRAASTKELEAVKLQVFENFLSKLSKI
jgi:sialic acid synthase SpsE